MNSARYLISFSLFCSTLVFLPGRHWVEGSGTFRWTVSAPEYSSDGWKLGGHVIATYGNTYLVTQCARRCLTSPTCASYNFLHGVNRCEINDASHVNSPSDLQLAEDAKYYLRDAFTVDKVALGPCADFPCSNGGTCLTSVPSNGILTYYCFCAKGWKGENCTDPEDVIDWSEWSQWSSCSSSCGDGVQVRTRGCVDTKTGNKKSPQLCYGPEQELQHCNLQECPYWSTWTDWSDCITATGCGAGNQRRTRHCTNGGTASIDRMCMGPVNETKPCREPACDTPIRLQNGATYGEGRIDVYDDVTMTWLPICADDWTQKSANVSCFQLGFQSGSFEAPKYSLSTGNQLEWLTGLSCYGTERRLASCRVNNWHGSQCTAAQFAGVQCIVNGQWSNWSEWGDCSVTCASGISSRTRQCDSPPPLRGGKDCVGNATQNKPCTLPFCPVDASWDNWQPWDGCSKTCGNGTQSRTRECIPGKYGGSNCTGNNMDTQNCNTQPCPVDGYYDDWSAWSSCSVTCSTGSQNRTRNCHQPQNGGLSCVGESSESQSCFDRFCPVDGFWSDWSSWSECNVTCGGGISVRNRNCTQPLYGGASCDGSKSESVTCNTNSCAVDGIWSEWGSWSSCNATCGSGTRIRVRICSGPFFGGKPCPGLAQDPDFCNDNPCPVNGEWSAWSRWGSCSVSCGSGIQTSYRICSAQNGGKSCSGDANRQQTCDPGPCPVDCVWLAWSAWTACNVSCGGGQTWRTRSSMQELYGGNPCNGSSTDVQMCNNNTCPMPGQWGSWSDWTYCSVTCGLGGLRARNRTCNMTTYGPSLTLPCLPLGGEKETKICNNFDCFPIARSCKEYFVRGLEDSSQFVTIDPDQDTGANAPFTILCQRNDTGFATTVHNMFETSTPVQGSSNPGIIKEFKLQYIDRGGNNITIDQLSPMVDASNSCSQYIAWKCYVYPMNSYLSLSVQRLIYWKNRYYESMGYWADTTTIDYLRSTSGITCSCGEKKACGRPDIKCNCDLADPVWRSDDGYLRNIAHLPVTTYGVTDTGNMTSRGSFSVGPLICLE